MSMEVNSVWQVSESVWGEAGAFRLLSIFAKLDVFVVFNTKKTTSVLRPRVVQINVFKNAVLNQNIRPETDTLSSHLLVDESRLTNAAKTKREKNWAIISSIVHRDDLVLSMATQYHQPDIARLAKVKQTDAKAIYRLLNRFWRFGQTRDAMLPDFCFCGGRGKQRENVTKSLGRKSISRTGAFPVRESYIVTEKDKDSIRKFLKSTYLKPSGVSLSQAYQDFLKTYFPNAIIDADFTQTRPNIPSFRQFRSWAKKLISQHDMIALTKHQTDYLQNYRNNESSIVSDNLVPGACFEIDATVIDVHIVSKWNRNKVLGRPTLYFIVDRASGMTVGLSVSLFYASWDAARLALFNALSSKVPYCRSLGIDITEKEWPCAHLPGRLIADNAEMLGLRAEESVVPMVPLEWAGLSRPDFKPFVEGRFNALNKSELHALAGSVRDKGKIIKSAPDPRSRAIYTLEELTEIIVRDVLDKNSTKRDRLSFQSKLLVETDTPPTPLAFWHVHVANYLSALKKVSAQEVEARLLRPVTVSVTANGIFWQEMYYSHEKVRKLNLSAIAKTNGRIQLEGRVNDECFDYIYVKLPNETTFTRCGLLKRSQEMKGLGLADVYYIQDWADDQHAKRPLPVSSIETLSVRNAITRQAKREAKSAPKPETKKARTDNRRKNRVEEMARSLEQDSSKTTDSSTISEPHSEMKKRQYSNNVLTLPSRGDTK
ncbi:transposase [Vibrio parahaemolyticus]|uniref:transposase n=1 Tax=Vibrio parahaemolyticus TaxID=670 RepID=UPI003AAABB3D